MTTHGTLRLERGRWRVTCTPHVRLRLRRLFEGISKKEHDELTISDTLEHCRELAWFLQRFPLTMTSGDRARLEHGERRHREHEATVASMLAEGYVARAFDMATPPRDYQAVAAALLLQVESLLVADDVGLGKTATAICAITDPRMRPALVVTMAHLPSQWVDEFAKFAPGLTVHVLKKGKPYPIAPFPDVIISSYHKLSGWADELAPRMRSVTFDEVQELRREGTNAEQLTAKYAAAQHVAKAATFRLGLSATPIYNYGAEMFNVFRVLAPGRLGTKPEFEREWCSGLSARIDDPKAFGKYLRGAGLMLRRTRRDVSRELPPLTRIPHTVDADLQKLAAIETTAAELARKILAETEEHRGDRLHASQELSMLLRQATGVAKAKHVAAFVRMLIESDERVALFGYHHEVYDIWRRELAEFRPAFYTGRESPTQKRAALAAFVHGDARCLVMSTRSGAGTDGLQHVCRTVVHGELDWSPAVIEQNIGRVCRDGQTEPVMAYFLLAECGSDPVIADVLGLKRQQAEGIRDPDADLVEELQVDDGHIRRLAEQYLERRGRAA